MKWVKIYRKLAIKRVLFFCNNIPSVDCTSRFSNPFQLNGISLYLMNFRLLNSTTKLLFSLFTLLLVSPTFVCIYSCIENPEINLIHSQWMNEWMNVCLFSVNNKKKNNSMFQNMFTFGVCLSNWNVSCSQKMDFGRMEGWRHLFWRRKKPIGDFHGNLNSGMYHRNKLHWMCNAWKWQ